MEKAEFCEVRIGLAEAAVPSDPRIGDHMDALELRLKGASDQGRGPGVAEAGHGHVMAHGKMLEEMMDPESSAGDCRLGGVGHEMQDLHEDRKSVVQGKSVDL